MRRTSKMGEGLRAALIASVLVAASGGCVQAQVPAEEPERMGAVRVSQLREDTIDQLLQLSQSEYALVRANAIEALEEVRSRASAVVGDRLLDQNEGVRSVAAMVAGRLGMGEHIARLENLKNDASPHVRAAAVYALRACGVDADPSVLADLVLGHSDPRVRAHAAFILGEIGDRSALGLLREATSAPMRRSSPNAVRLMRLQMAEAMVKLGDDEQLSVIRAALYPARAEELEAAALAVQILGEVEDRAVIDQLIELTKGSEETDRAMPAEVRLAAASALARMGLPQGTFVADEYRESELDVLRAQAASVYGEAGSRGSVPVLDAMRRDGSEMVRVAACGALLKVTEGMPARARVGG